MALIFAAFDYTLLYPVFCAVQAYILTSKEK